MAGIAVVALLAAACGSGNADDTDVLGIQIDRESTSEAASQAPTEPSTPSSAPTASAPPTSTAPATPTSTPSPTTTPPPSPEPTQTAPPAEVAEAGAYSGALQEWAIGDDGVAYPRTQAIAPEQVERNPDGTTSREPDWYDVIDVTLLDGNAVEAVCTAVATADDHRDLVVSGTVTIDLLVDDVVVATTTSAVDTAVGAGTTASLASMEPHGPIVVGEQSGDAVTITCRVTFG